MRKVQSKKPPHEDQEQSRRFIEAAREIEADGGLSPTEADMQLDAIVRGKTNSTNKAPSQE